MAATDPLRVMIVDDEPTVRLGLTNLLGKMDVPCIVVGEARNGVDALKKTEKLKPNLIFTDIRMPNMDGIELSRKLAEVSPNTFVVLLTGYADFDYARQGIRAAVFDYLLKPAAASDLRKVIERAKLMLNRPASSQQEESSRLLSQLLTGEIESLAVQEALNFMLTHYQQPLGIKEVAGHVYLNASYFSVLFKKETGYAFSDFLKKIRIEKSKQLLKQLDLKIYEVAELSGFQTGRYFTDVFKEHTGMLPSEYRNMQTC